MKTPSDELYNLIKSLSTQEKVQFKIYASRKEADSNKVILFDAINAMERYDERQLKEKLRNRLPVKDLHVLKNYTIEAILRSMAQYHASDSVNSKLHRYLQDIYFLVKKRLFASARKTIAKAEKLANENNQYEYLFILFSLKREVMVEEVNMQEINKYPSGQYPDEIRNIEILRNDIDYSRLYMQIESINYNIHGPFEESSERYMELLSLLKNPLLENEKRALSMSARLKYHSSRANLYRLLNDWERSYSCYKKVIQLLEQSPSYLNSRAEFYLTMIDRFSVAMVRLRKHQELITFYNKAARFMDTLPKKLRSSSISQSYLAIRIHYIEYLLSVFDIYPALKFSEGIKSSIKEYYNPEQFLIFHGNLFFIYSFLDDYRRALKHVNEILNVKESGIRQEIINNAKIFNLVVHYELSNWDLLPNLCKAAFRYLRKKNQLHEAEKILLGFFSKAADNKTPGIQDMTALKEKLEPILSRQNIFDNFDFISWIDSKMESRPYLEIARKRAARAKGTMRQAAFTASN